MSKAFELNLDPRFAASPAGPANSVSGNLPRKKFWQSILKHPYAMPYNRLAVAMVIVNLFCLAGISMDLSSAASLAAMQNFTLWNFAAAILIRNQYVINFLFAAATSVPTHWPLSLRWALGKVYHFGGIHVGCFFAGSLWLALYLASAPSLPSGMSAVIALHLTILLAMMTMALPAIRARYHNAFERTARFGGWTSLLLFWTQTFMLLNHEHQKVLQSPAVAVLALITFSVALPWLRLRRVEVDFAKPSNHAVLADFNYGVTPFAGSSTDLSLSPLTEWHSFANVPLPGREGFKLTISRAGDWTGRLIDQTPKHIWVKGIPTAGVGNIELLFKKVIWVATGSGIGPCLPHLFANKVPSRLVWSTRNPQKTYGSELVNEILAAQPEALVWDTDQNGKPDLVKLAYQAYVEFGAEAVICISNKKVTFNLVQELESRGIPAFGAIWDS